MPMSEDRTWKCPECGHTVAISYDWLAQHGGPACEKCDCDMELEPLPDIVGEVSRLVDKAETAGLTEEDLDEAIHELASGAASELNNGGLDQQVKYLVEGLGLQGTEREIDALIERRQGNEET